MYAAGTKKGTVRFSFKPAIAAKSIGLAGNFNDWQIVKMVKQKNGGYAVSMSLPPGSYEYKFVVDGQWIVDPDTNTWAMNPYGTFNSIAQVE